MKVNIEKKTYIEPSIYVVNGVVKTSFLAGSDGYNPEFNVDTNLPGLGGFGGGGNPASGN